MPEDMPDRMPENMSDRMPEDLPVTKCINVMVGITRSKVIFFPLPAFRQRQMGPAAQEQSQRPAQLLAALKYPGWVLF